jgi:integrase
MDKTGHKVDYSFEYVTVEREDSQAIYITEEEIEKIFKLKIKTKAREIVRDRFIANYCLGMRYGDFCKLTSANIKGNVVVRKTEKTGVIVEVPIHRLLKSILEKYGGFPLYDKSTQAHNKMVKTVCRQAGLTDKVLIERTKGHKVIRKSVKRYEMVSSHTARRSFATNAYLAGIPIARIMLVTGHKTEAAFFRYIRIGRAENAKTLSEHPFFK